MRPRHLRRRGLMWADAVLAMGITIALASTMAVALTRQQRASRQLAETRAAVRLAEATMIALQTGQTPPAAPSGATVRVQPLAAPPEPPAHCAWAMVTVTMNGHTGELTGVIRADALKGAAP